MGGSEEQSFRLLLDMIPGFVYTASPAGEIEISNQQILEFLGKTVEEARDWHGLIHPDDRERVTSKWTRSMASGEPFDDIHRGLRFDGTYRWLHSRAVPLKRDGRIVR